MSDRKKRTGAGQSVNRIKNMLFGNNTPANNNSPPKPYTRLSINSDTSPEQAVKIALEHEDSIIEVPSDEYRNDLITSFAIGRANAELARIDNDLNLMGWRDVSNGSGQPDSFSGYDLTPDLRERAIWLSRKLFYSNGLINQMIDIWTDFTIGEGIKIHVTGAQANNALKDIWNGAANYNIFSTLGLRQTNQRLVVDGELPILIARTDNRTVKIRRIPPEQIKTVISNPDDADEIWGYHRQIPATGIRGKHKNIFIRDWRELGPEDGITVTNVDTGEEEKQQWKEGMFIVPININTLGQRGNPLCLSSFGWAQAMESFMRSRVIIERAISTFAFRITVKGNKKDMSRVRSRVNTSITTSSDNETNSGQTPGNWFIGNEGVDMEPMKFETGAKAAQIDGGMILMMLGIGAGIYPHWLGGGDSFRLATAKSMEPPMKRQFSAHQSIVCEGVKTVLATAMKMIGVPAGQIETLRCDAPEVMQNDLNERVIAFARVSESAPWLQQIPEVRQHLLELLGQRNPVELHKVNQKDIDKTVNDWIKNKTGKNKNKPAPQGDGIRGRKPETEDGPQKRREKKQDEK